MRGNRFCATLVDCPICKAPSELQCGVNVPGDIPNHTERARQSRWLQMYTQSSASKLGHVFDEDFTEVQ
jgi:hypothetical protein